MSHFPSLILLCTKACYQRREERKTRSEEKHDLREKDEELVQGRPGFKLLPPVPVSDHVERSSQTAGRTWREDRWGKRKREITQPCIVVRVIFTPYHLLGLCTAVWSYVAVEQNRIEQNRTVFSTYKRKRGEAELCLGSAVITVF